MRCETPPGTVTSVRAMKVCALFVALAAVALPAERYALVLEDAPLAAQATNRKDLARLAASDARSRLQASHAAVRERLAKKQIRVTGANQLLANVLFVQASRASEAELRNLPGVAYVERLPKLELHLNAALELMNVPGAWGAVNGEQNAGTGVKIGVLDTGIDHTHPAFRDDGYQYPAGFPICQEARGDCGYVNRKVIVARSYVHMLAGSASDPEITRPDDLSPRDRVGHGTAVAMIAAGQRSTGPAATITGVAPKAYLGNYKVFGSPGVNGRFTYDDVILQAIEDAVRDGMDIITTSLGAPAVWGPGDSGGDCSRGAGVPCDWRANAIEQANRLGLVVVISAGNEGTTATRYPAYNSITTPGSAPGAITVGASTNRHIWYQTLKVEGSGAPAGLTSINALFGDGPKPNPTLTAPARDVSRLGNDGKACTPLANGSLSGAIAVIERGDCSLELKILHAQRAGAAGVVIIQQQGANAPFPMMRLQATGIPALMVGNTAGMQLRNYLGQNANAQVTMDARYREVSTGEFDTIGVFSSRGPALFRPSRPTSESGIKPELVATGTDLYVATQKYDPNGDMYDASGYVAVEGTSFAAPMVAGAAAIVKQRYPGMRPEDIKSAVVNTASAEVFDIDADGRTVRAGVLEAGAGKLNAEAAARTNVTASPSTLWFGVAEGGTVARGLTFRNHGSTPLTLRFSEVPYGNANTRLTIAPPTAAVAPGGSTEIRIQLSGPRPSPGVYEGWIVVTGGAVNLRVPYLYLVGDGVPFSILPLEGDGFELATGATNVPLTFKVVDQYGVPVPRQSVRFQVVSGGGAIEEQGQQTDELGIGYADVTIGPELGEQEFYAAVGDANRNFGIYFTGRAFPRPAITSGGIVNAASLRQEEGLAPGSYITIYGRGLSETERLAFTQYLPLSLAGTSVSFDVPSQNLSYPGRVHFVSDAQVNVQIPWELQGASSAVMKVSIGDYSSSTVTIPLRDYSPAAFEYTEAGTGRLLAAALDVQNQLVGTGNPARKGQVIQLFANGLGPVDSPPASGEQTPTSGPLVRTRAVPAVTIGGRPAEVSFSGLTPGQVGLYQVNVQVPSDAPSGLQPLVITANGIESKVTTVPIE